MLSKNNKAIENTFSINMLNESINNPAIKAILVEMGDILIKEVLGRLKSSLSKVTEFKELDKADQELVHNLAAEHSAERRQYGALFPEIKHSDNILNSKASIIDLLDKQESALLSINKISSIDEMAVALKIMVELGYTYYEAPTEWHTDRFAFIKESIYPSLEESDIRLFRKELGEKPKLALTLGIETEESDLVNEEDINEREDRAFNSGKAVFGAVSMRSRLMQVIAEYDETQSSRSQERMERYQIPLNKEERESIDIYTKRWTTFFEKLAIHPNNDTAMPLIASVSRATARLLVSLHDLNAFRKENGGFDLDKAQLFANSIMGFIVHAGHHSTVEVAEAYNRLIDCAAIEHLNANNSPIIPAEQDSYVENKLPYFRYGKPASFFHHSIRSDVTAGLEEAVTLKK